MTSPIKQKKIEKNSLQKKNQTLQEELVQLQNQLEVYRDLKNLENETVYRQQMLVLLERIAIALEKSLGEEESSENSEEEPEEDEEE